MRIEKFAAQEGYKLKVRNPINYVKEDGNEK